MKKIFTALFLCCACMCTLFMSAISANAYDYKYIWSETFFKVGEDYIDIVFMSPLLLEYDEVYYLIPFIIFKNHKELYKGVAQAPKEMNSENVVKYLCEEGNINKDLEGFEKAQELCDRRKDLNSYEISEFVESELRPLHLVPEALEAHHELFTFTIQIGRVYGNQNSSSDANRLRVRVSPNATVLPSWARDIIGNFDGVLG